MTQDEMKQAALRQVKDTYPDVTETETKQVYPNFLDGTLVAVSYKNKEGTQWSYVHFGGGEPIFYRYNSEVMAKVANYKESSWFFRFLEFAGIGGLIAFTLVLIFSLLLGALAIMSKPDSATHSTIVEVIKLSFTIILGYFFGQASSRK